MGGLIIEKCRWKARLEGYIQQLSLHLLSLFDFRNDLSTGLLIRKCYPQYQQLGSPLPTSTRLFLGFV